MAGTNDTLDDVVAAITALAAGETLGTLAADNTAIAALINAVKAKTDPMTYTIANQLDVNAKSMNGYTIYGAGVVGNLWRGAV